MARVLLVESAARGCPAHRELLERLGHQVESTASTDFAVQRLAREPNIEAVILDLSGPKRRLDALTGAAGGALPLIGLAGLGPLFAHPRTAERLDAILPRPVEPERFREVLDELLHGAAGRAGAARMAALREAHLAAFAAVAAQLDARGSLGCMLAAALRPFVQAEAFDFCAIYLRDAGGRWSPGAAVPARCGEPPAALVAALEAARAAPLGLPDPRWPELRAEMQAHGVARAQLRALAEGGAVLLVGSRAAAFERYGAALLDAAMPTLQVALHLALSMGQLSASEARFRALAESLPRGLMSLDADGRVAWANARAAEMLGRAELAGSRPAELGLPPEGGTIEREGRTLQAEVQRHHATFGQVLTTLLLTDCSEERQREADLRDAALHDPLTGLLNRRGLELEAARALGRMGAGGLSVAVIVLDLDGFKAVNDEFGHAAGDALLARIARELEAGFRATDLLARPGGDEFVLLCPDLRPGSGPHLALSAKDAVERAAHALGHPLRVSVGYTCAPHEGEPLDLLIQRADRAMYSAKRAGGGQVHGAQGAETSKRAPR